MDWRKRKGIGIHPSWGPSNCSAMVAPTVEAVLTGMMLPVVKVENLRWGKSIFSMGPPAIRHSPSGADVSEYLMPYLPAISNCRQFCTDVVIWSYSTVPVAFCLPFLCIFINLEIQERYLPIIRGAGTLFPCIPKHFNHWMLLHGQWQCTRTLVIRGETHQTADWCFYTLLQAQPARKCSTTVKIAYNSVTCT